MLWRVKYWDFSIEGILGEASLNSEFKSLPTQFFFLKLYQKGHSTLQNFPGDVVLNET